MKYRPEIDGLRAVALLPVIFFHANYPGFTGGYVGVDVFFVISGFLITTIIVRERARERFSIADFYERRARRILPALFFVLLVTFGAGWWLMYPHQLVDLSRGLVATALFIANILLAADSVGARGEGYFDAGADENTLLHMWSLAVEEQYYVVFPLFLMGLWFLGRKRLGLTVLAVAVVSFVWSEYGVRHSPNEAFYWPQYRAWELLLGSVLAFVSLDKQLHERAPGWVNQLLGAAGLAMIAVAVVLFDGTTPFPGAAALVPTLGSALIIGFAHPGTAVGWLLSRRALVAIGLISYSAYLWHQPLFAFARISLSEHPTPAMYGVLSVLSLVLAYVSWRWIESPFRDKSRFTRTAIFRMSGLGILVMVALGAVGITTNGGEFRYNDEQRSILAYREILPRTVELYREGRCFLTPRFSAHDFAGECLEPLDEPGSMIIWGDSHAAALWVGLDQRRPGKVAQLNTSSCPAVIGLDQVDPQCKVSNAIVLEHVKSAAPVVVVMHAAWMIPSAHEGFEESLRRAVLEVRKRGGLPILVGPVPRWGTALPEIIASNLYGADQALAEMSRWQRPAHYERDRADDATVRRVAEALDVPMLSVMDRFCRAGECLMVFEPEQGGLVPVAWDYGHLTLPVAQALADEVWQLADQARGATSPDVR